VTAAAPKSRSTVLPALIAGALAVLAAAAFWWRLRRQAPPTRTQVLTARARAASRTLASTKEQVAASAAPLLLTGRQVSAGARERAAVQGRAAAEQTAVQARAAAERAAARARTAAQQAAEFAAVARTLRVQRVLPSADLEAQPVPVPETAGRWQRVKALGVVKGLRRSDSVGPVSDGG
jgi:cytoskeletal protein RodZ